MSKNDLEDEDLSSSSEYDDEMESLMSNAGKGKWVWIPGNESPPGSPPLHVQVPVGEEEERLSTVLRFSEVSHGAHTPVPSPLPTEARHPNFVKMMLVGEVLGNEEKEVCAMLKEMIRLRYKHVYIRNNAGEKEISPSLTPYVPFEEEVIPPKLDTHTFAFVDGVVVVKEENKPVYFVESTMHSFLKDVKLVMRASHNGPARTFCYRRLEILQSKFGLHQLLNLKTEAEELKRGRRDLYTVRKVDTHIHLASAMNEKRLLRFMRHKVRDEPHAVVAQEAGKPVTLGEVFSRISLNPRDVTVDHLDMRTDRLTFQRFDRFNQKYNPGGQENLRKIFLKTENHAKGKYFAEITRELFANLEETKYQHVEPRVSVYGRSREEWSDLAEWARRWGVFSEKSRFLIQIPRLYNVHKEQGRVHSFQEMLENIFVPLFEVTLDPSSNETLHLWLKQVVGFDSVDDETLPETYQPKRHVFPSEWINKHNPPFAYYIYFLHANLVVLNKLRASRGLNTFAFRPHAGEAGALNHLGAAFLTANGINHGVRLKKSPVLNYVRDLIHGVVKRKHVQLFYLCQIGIAMSPLSNNSLFVPFQKSPFPRFFSVGMNVSLSTDDPLQFHVTREALMEEYSIATHMWRLSRTDVCEIARNSVIQSGFEHPVKMYWLGKDYRWGGMDGNDLQQTNIPNVRMLFRHETLIDELRIIQPHNPGPLHVSLKGSIPAPGMSEDLYKNTLLHWLEE